ncbi:unnamed protein product [Closterium sp. Yama58-4]|nr:unnamed protein product [Closterium sp. Yama58-4]
MWGHLTSSLRRLTVRSGEPHTAPDKPLVVVFGATGAQGSSVVAALLASGRYRIRAVTRHADSPRAAHLRDAKVDVAQADQADRQAVRAALEGAYGAFVVTDYYSLGEREEEVGRGVVEEARGAGVQHVVWSTLPHVHRLSKGQLNVPHFTGKAKVHASRSLPSFPAPLLYPLMLPYRMPLLISRPCVYAPAAPRRVPHTRFLSGFQLLHPPWHRCSVPSLLVISSWQVEEVVRASGFKHHTFVMCAFYYQNFSHFNLTREEADGTVVFELPMGPDDMLTAFDVDDTGAAVLNALDHPDDWDGEYMCLAGYHAPVHQYISDFHRVTGHPARLHTTDKAASEEWTQMFRWFSQHTYFGCHDISNARRCNPHLKTWRQVVE